MNVRFLGVSRMRAGSRAAGLAMMFALSAGSVAQQVDAPNPPVSNAIAVMVNDEPVTLFDIAQRERFLLATSGGVQNEQQLRILRRRVVETLIEDALKIQEARDREFLDAIPDRAYEERFAQFAGSFNLSPEQFADYLGSIGSSKQTLISQIRSQFLWDGIISGLFGSRAAVGDEEVESRLDRLEASAGDYEYRLSEIQLLIPSPSEENRITALANQIANRLGQGELSFAGAALQFSQSTSAANGGSLGWLSEGQMRDSWTSALTAMEVGDVSAPIRSPGSITILQMTDRRRILTADPLDARVTLKQMVLALNQESLDSGQVTQIIERATPRLSQMQSCDEVDPITRESGFDRALDLGVLNLRDLPTELRRRIVPLQPVSATKPILTGDQLMVLVICDRQEAQIRPPEFDDIQRQLEGERLAAFARRYLRDLRRDAVIDYRIPIENL